MLRLGLGLALGASLRVGLKEGLTPGLGDIKYDKKNIKWWVSFLDSIFL